MDAENIKDVIDELVGPIVPTGSESIDINRLNNLKKYEKILPMICEDIKIIRDKYIDSPYQSEKNIGLEAEKILKEISEYDKPPVDLYTWIEDLIWCPSQCYYYFIDKLTNTKYCIYLRWRHSDPWTAELIECEDNWGFSIEKEWEYLDIKDYKDSEYKKLEKEALKLIKSKFPNSIP